MARGTTITIPDEIDDAIRAEAYRLGCRPGEVLVCWLRQTFPDFIRGQLTADLQRPLKNLIIDATAESTTPPEAPDGVDNLNACTIQVPEIVPPGDLHLEEPPGHGQAI